MNIHALFTLKDSNYCRPNRAPFLTNTDHFKSEHPSFLQVIKDHRGIDSPIM